MIKTLASEFQIGKEVVKNLNQGINLGNYREGGIINPFAHKDASVMRVSKAELERIYLKDPQLRNSVKRQQQMVGASGYHLEYHSEEEQNFFEKFFNEMGSVGDDCDFDQIYKDIPKNEIIFGANWTELVWDEEDERIVDINRLDAKRMDYARNSSGDIVLDNNQKIIGYTMQLPKGYQRKRGDNLGDAIPIGYDKLVSLGSDRIFLLPKRIALIRFEEEGDGLEFWGLVETIYHDVLRKGDLEKAGFNSAFQRWMSPLVGYIGDPTHPPTPQLASQTLNSMKKMKHDLLTVLPYFVKLDSLKGNEMESYIEMLKSLRENSASGIQMPMPFAISSGEATNRATLNNQQSMLEFSLNELTKYNSTMITKKILKPIALSNGLTTWPTLIPNRVSVDEVDDKASRYNDYIASGLFSVEELIPILAKMEGITLIKAPEKKEVTDKEDKPNKQKEDEDEVEDGE